MPKHLQADIMKKCHGGKFSGHLSGARLYKTLARTWWWEGMYQDIISYCKSCPQCAFVFGGGRIHKPLLQPITGVQRPFQIIGVDVMELPRTTKGNKYVLVFQDFLTKWPMVFPISRQRSIRLVHLLVDEVIPMFGVPEALLSDRGTNLLSHLMLDVCKYLGIKKLNTTAYHPQCDGMVERFNRTLKTMLRKHADSFRNQWDRYLSAVVWAYRNTPHESTEKNRHSYYLDLIVEALQKLHFYLLTKVDDYNEELMFSLSSARALATENIQQA